METTVPSTAITSQPPLAGPAPASAPRPKEKPMWLRALEALASLRLTVVLFVLSAILVFYGTWAQRETGIWDVMRDYFRSLIAFIPVRVLTFFALPAEWSINQVRIPYPGGWLLGGLLFTNLLAAHAVRFKLSWKRAGVIVLHVGVILMMLGEFFTGLFATEGLMYLGPGETVNFVQDTRNFELAVVFPDDEKRSHDRILAFYAPKIKEGEISHPELPFTLKIKRHEKNSELFKRRPGDEPSGATRGHGVDMTIKAKPEVNGVDPNQNIDDPCVVAEIISKTGESLGSVVMTPLMERQYGPEEIKVGDKTYEVSFRLKRSYRPYTITLDKAVEDKHPGMQMAKEYKSWIKINDPERNVKDRPGEIFMNAPLTYRGETFYQQTMFMGPDGVSTGLQVVYNWAKPFPYLSCAVVALGMLMHFGATLKNFLDVQARKVSSSQTFPEAQP